MWLEAARLEEDFLSPCYGMQEHDGVGMGGRRWGKVRPGWVHREVVARSTHLEALWAGPPKVGGIFRKAQVQTDITHTVARQVVNI